MEAIDKFLNGENIIITKFENSTQYRNIWNAFRSLGFQGKIISDVNLDNLENHDYSSRMFFRINKYTKRLFIFLEYDVSIDKLTRETRVETYSIIVANTFYSKLEDKLLGRTKQENIITFKKGDIVRVRNNEDSQWLYAKFVIQLEGYENNYIVEDNTQMQPWLMGYRYCEPEKKQIRKQDIAKAFNMLNFSDIEIID